MILFAGCQCWAGQTGETDGKSPPGSGEFKAAFAGKFLVGTALSQDLDLQARYNPFKSGLPSVEERAQRDHYAGLFRILLNHAESVSRVSFWGVSDAHSWRNNWPMKGRTDYPLLFNRELQAKPVYFDLIGLANADSDELQP